MARSEPLLRSITLNRTWRDYALLVGLAGVIILIDQLTKWLVRTYIPFQSMWMPEGLSWLAPFVRIVNWSNSGAAFGTFQEGNTVFSILAILVIAAILYYYPRVERSDWTLRLAMGLQLGGAAGNLVDRLILHRVTDFIAVGAFPVFNVADASISIGVAVLILGVWLKERQEKRRVIVKE